MEEIFNQMVWIIPQNGQNYFYQKEFGRRHKEGIDKYIEKENLNLKANSEYDGLVKLASLGNIAVLNNGKSENGYIGICVMPDVISESQMKFLNLVKEILNQFDIFQISMVSNGKIIPFNQSNMKDIEYLYNVYLNQDEKRTSNIYI